MPAAKWHEACVSDLQERVLNGSKVIRLVVTQDNGEQASTLCNPILLRHSKLAKILLACRASLTEGGVSKKSIVGKRLRVKTLRINEYNNIIDTEPIGI